MSNQSGNFFLNNINVYYQPYIDKHYFKNNLEKLGQSTVYQLGGQDW